ncbi:Uu.00g125840.m01.CDS01 [Anthostomella pinea]|uniref:Uu.00g125840.m01.CDS01 n=1 Tax=Anthostomella pinea TaxID=933095 RepID=A0AAI8YHM3_9PEZI|nr:Uu.00g125840.m01.CDS01 [Anthostomella pinea]
MDDFPMSPYTFNDPQSFGGFGVGLQYGDQAVDQNFADVFNNELEMKGGDPQSFSEPVPAHHDSTRCCGFRQGLLDECYQSRLYAMALEYYYLEAEDPRPLQTYRCLMSACQKRDFKDPKAMLRHLKHCTLFPQGNFWCPTCGVDESFRTTSKKRCSWDRVRFGQKLQKKVQHYKDFFRGLAGPSEQSTPTATNQGSCPACGSFIPSTDTPVNHSFSDRPGTFCKPELPNSQLVFRLPAELPDMALGELPAMALGEHFIEGDYLQLHPRQQSKETYSLCLPYPELDCSPPTIVVEQAPNLISPSGPSTASPSRNGVHSTDVSPTSSAESSKPTTGIQIQCFQPVGHMGYFGQDQAGLPGQQLTRWNYGSSTASVRPPNDAIYGLSAALPPPSRAQSVSRSERVPSLTINTSQLISNMDTSAWARNVPCYDGSAYDLKEMETPILENYQPMAAASSFDTGAGGTSSAGSSALSGAHNTASFDTSPSKTAISSSSSGLAPSSVLTDPDLQCHFPGCEFTPKGKPENLKSYMRKHLRTHKDIHIQCPECYKTFTRQDNLTHHLRAAHKRRRDSSGSDELPSQQRRKSVASITWV